MTGEEPAGAVALTVPATLDGERVDRSVATLGGLTRSVAGRLVDEGQVVVGGTVVTQRSRPLRAGQHLAMVLPERRVEGPGPDPSVAFAVVHEDADLVVVDKPAGLVVHHGAGHAGGTLVDGLLARYPDLADLPRQGLGDPTRPGIVHRLDKDTSGLMVVARSPRAFTALGEQLRRHQARRSYLALVHGVPAAAAGLVDAPLGRSTRTPTKMAVAAGGRPARTAYRVRQAFASPLACALLEVELQTGRTHQVRVHLSAIGHPVVGDPRYSPPHAIRQATEVLGARRQFLHAWRLTLRHPDGSERTWESDLPDDLRAVLAALAA